jgi:type IV secretion system protein TrbE
LAERLEHIARLLPFAKVKRFGDDDHLGQYRRLLNPSLPTERMPGTGSGCMWSSQRTVMENTFFSDGLPFRSPREGLVGLHFDEHYHALFVVRDWPRQTEPGIIHTLTSAVRGNAAITLNLYPCDVQAEIHLLEKERAELLKQCDDPKKYHLKSEVERKARRIATLMEGQSLPFKALMIVRVWARTPDALGESCLAIKSAFQHLTGCRYHQVNHAAQARNLFYETLPGWLGGSSRAWDCDAESSYLADLLPLSSTFTGHLDSSEMLLDGADGGVVGLRLFSHGTPQHACLVGMRGAGKSSVTMEVLSQTEQDSAFTGIIEEGLSYGTYAQLNGYQSLILRPGASYTWNYLDTQGLPLTPGHLADAAALLVKLAGVSPSDETNKLRAALLTEYLVRLYEAAAEDWLAADEGRAFRLARRACAIHRWGGQALGVGGTFLDAFSEWRDADALGSAAREKALTAEALLSEAEVTSFMKDRLTGSLVRDLVFTELSAQAFPTHHAVCAVLRSGRLPHHRSLDMARELDLLATLLGKWRAVGGLYGPLVDGSSNISFSGRGLHVELGYLGEGNTELKEVAGFLAITKMRQRVVGMRRTERKRLIYEEVAKFLTVPGAAGILAENYAQFRKYRCWVLTVFQNAEQLSRVDPALLRTLRANSTQFWFMRHQDAESLAAMGDGIGLPHAARKDIQSYPLPEHQRASERASYFNLFSKDEASPVCGTVRVKVSDAMRYVADSSGEVFEERKRALASAPDPLSEVLRLSARKEAA